MRKIFAYIALLALAGYSLYADGTTQPWNITNVDLTSIGVMDNSGNVTFAGRVNCIGIVSTGTFVQNEDVDINFDALDEEVDITTSSGTTVGRGTLRVINSDTTPGDQHYLLELTHRNLSRDADGDYLICRSSAAGSEVTNLTIDQSGTITQRNGETIGNDTNGATSFSGDITVVGADINLLNTSYKLTGDSSNYRINSSTKIYVPTIQLSNNIIHASDGGTTLTLDTSDNLTVLGDVVISGNNLDLGSANIDYAGYAVAYDTNINMSNQPILNIGNAGTDFSSAGGLTLEDDLTVTGNNISDSGGVVFTFDGSENVTVAGAVITSSLTTTNDLRILGNDLYLGYANSLGYSSYRINSSTKIYAPTIQLSDNIIHASDGGTTMTLDTSDNVTVTGAVEASTITSLGDIRIVGNDIYDAGGLAITFDGSGKVTGAADIEATGDLIAIGNDVQIGASEKLTYTAYTIQSSTPIDMNVSIISNIGNAGTDFDSSGGLTLASDFTVTSSSIIVGQSIRMENDLELGNHTSGQFDLQDASGNTLFQVTDAGTAGNVDVSGTLGVTGNTTMTKLTLNSDININSFVTMADSGTVTTSSSTYILASKNTGQEIELPDAATSDGKIFIIKKTGSAGVVTIDANGGTIDGADPVTQMDTQYDYMGIVSDGTNWHVFIEKEH